MIHSIVDTLRWTDVLDVAVVGFILYGVIAWARRSASSNMVIACIGFGGLYMLSRALDLYLTRALVQAILAVAVLAVVIVFQDDLRRLLDHVGAWTLRRRTRTPAATGNAVVDVLARTATHLAERRTGALIALRGAESWDRAIDGGIEIDGKLSTPLLESIFDHHSAGHDGAVLIERGRIARFATHLPLSSNHDARGGHGTRHAAALGLSEACDALVLVVSEETGQISVAEHGVLTSIDAASLASRLLEFHARHTDNAARRDGRAWWRGHRLQNAVLAIAVAVGLWLGFARKTDFAVRTMTVPIELRGLDPALALDETSDTEARITLEGPRRAFDLVDEGELVVVVSLASLDGGSHVIEITQEQLDLPRDVTLSRVEPNFILVSTKKAEPPPSP